MIKEIHMESCYAPSEQVVAREIEGDLIIVPLTAEAGAGEDDMFTTNETGRAIWQRLDGRTDLRNIVNSLALEFEAPVAEIERDVRGFVEELLKRNMLQERKS